MSLIKICGLKRIEDVYAVNEFKPDYVGFVFAATKRFVSDETAAILKVALNPDIPAVGVFVNEPIAHIVKLVREKSIDIIQLHGQEDLDYVNRLREALKKEVGSQDKGEASRVPLIKVVRIDVTMDERLADEKLSDEKLADEKTVDENAYTAWKEKQTEINRKLILEAKKCEPEYLLFDSKVKGIPGGSGQTFDIANLPDDEEIGLPYFLAGGIDLSNVADLISLKRPFGIDVSSAVETEGIKDAEKIKAMIEAVRYSSRN
ncbi:MAG: phosphoribosylanthranilate isomerase [Lachnospiraceae bacterium]|nr:phosphoribosylanthranilate isomerase [Lachnospiraceae bacterium]